MNISKSVAESVPWCLEMPDLVHRASWTREEGGWLIALSADRDGAWECGPHSSSSDAERFERWSVQALAGTILLRGAGL